MSCSASTNQRALIPSSKFEPRLSSVRCLFQIFDWVSSIVSVLYVSLGPSCHGEHCPMDSSRWCCVVRTKGGIDTYCHLFAFWYIAFQNTSAMPPPRQWNLWKSARTARGPPRPPILTSFAKSNDPAHQAGFRDWAMAKYFVAGDQLLVHLSSSRFILGASWLVAPLGTTASTWTLLPAQWSTWQCHLEYRIYLVGFEYILNPRKFWRNLIPRKATKDMTSDPNRLPWKVTLIAGTQTRPLSKWNKQEYPNIMLTDGVTCLCPYLRIPINFTHASCLTRKAARAFLNANKEEDRTKHGDLCKHSFVSQDCIGPMVEKPSSWPLVINQIWHIFPIENPLEGSKTHVCSSHSAGPCAWCCPLMRACAHPNTPYISCIHIAPTNAWCKISEESTAVWWNRTSQKANKHLKKNERTNKQTKQNKQTDIHCESLWENPPLLEVQSILHCVAWIRQHRQKLC